MLFVTASHMNEVQPTVEWLFGEIKTYKLVEFMSQLKIGLNSVEIIYSAYGILENAKACLYSYKTVDVCLKKTQSLICCYCPEMKIYRALNKHPGFLQE